jgi:hypothetical protein
MSREEVEKELDRIRQGFGEITIDVTPEEVKEETTQTEEHRGGVVDVDDKGAEDNQQEDRTDKA